MCFLSSDLGLDLRCFCSHIQTCCGRGVSQQFEVPSQAVSECVHVNVILEAEIIRTFGQFLQQLVYCLALSGAGVADFEVFGVTIVRHLPRIFLVATLTPGGVGGLVSRVWLPSQRMLCLTIFRVCQALFHAFAGLVEVFQHFIELLLHEVTDAKCK